MEIVFVAITKANWGRYYPGIPHAIRAAEARSGCRVWCVTDAQNVQCSNLIPLSNHYQTSAALIEETTELARSRWAINSLCRWLVVRDFTRSRQDLVWPILALDYDVIVFSDLREAYKPFMDADFTTFVQGRGSPAAYGVHNAACLDAGVDMIFKLAHTVDSLNDMAVWSALLQSGKWKVGDLTPELNDGAFDPNIHDDQKRYATEPSTVPMWGPTTKKLTWKDGRPHFTRLTDGALVRAHWIHCWGSYKQRTAELIQKAGL